MENGDNSYELRPAGAVVAPVRRAGEVQRTDRPCPSCGYNLRGLEKGHRCPECGAFPPPAFHDELQFANREWVGRLSLGMTGAFLGFAMFPVGLVMGFLVRSGLVIVGVAAMGSMVAGAGLWMLTSPEPAVSVEKAWSLRALLRWATVGAWVGEMVGAGWLVAAMGGGSLPEWVAVVIFYGVLAALGIRTALVGYFLQALARRIPNDELWNRIVPGTFGLLFGCVVAVPAMFVMSFGGSRASMMFCVGTPLLLPMAIYFWGMWLLWGFVVDLRACAVAARGGKEE